VDTELEVFGELFVEFLEIFSILRNTLEHFQYLLNDVFLDNFKDFVVLKEFS